MWSVVLSRELNSVTDNPLAFEDGSVIHIQVSPTKQICKVFVRKLNAEAWERRQKELLKSEDEIKPTEQTMTISELAEYWVENYAKQHKEESSVVNDKKMFKNQILPAMGSKRLSEIAPRSIE